jgi:phosphonoacetate hydrolase
MNDKSNAQGKPNVIWLQDILDAKFGKGDTRVICPITDAFVGHHGALGGFVRVWCTGKATARQVMDAIHGIPGIESVLDKETACKVHDLPMDREADVVVISTAEVCVGGAAAAHDLSGLEGHRLRTHGGVSEAKVPFILSEPLNDEYRLKAGACTLKSYQIFDYAINGVQQ